RPPARPPKLTEPMILFFLPVLFAVILGPTGIKIRRCSDPHRACGVIPHPLVRRSLGVSGCGEVSDCMPGWPQSKDQINSGTFLHTGVARRSQRSHTGQGCDAPATILPR